MTKVLVIQGQGMDLRGKTQVEIFGPETLDEINAQIEAHARELGLAVEIVQSNDEDVLATQLNGAAASEFDAILINPAGFMTSTGPLPQALKTLPIPAYEIHASNPASRGITSNIQPVCTGAICGFGYAGYRLGLEAIKARAEQS